MARTALLSILFLFCNIVFANDIGWPDLDVDVCDNLSREDPTDAKESDFDIGSTLQRVESYDSHIKRSIDHLISVEMQRKPAEENYAEWVSYELERSRAYDAVIYNTTVVKGTLLRYNTLLMRQRYLAAQGEIKAGLKSSYEHSKKLFCSFVESVRWPS